MNRHASIDDLFAELVKEFNAKKKDILKDPRLWSNVRTGSHAEPGKTRYSGAYQATGEPFFSSHDMAQYFRFLVKDFSASRKIFDMVMQNAWWPKKADSFELDTFQSPSITQNIVAGFLVRNFELNHFRFEITDQSFEQTKNEFENFINKDSIDITCILSLHGPHGDVEKIPLEKGVSIEQADFQTARLFGLAYSTIADGFYIDLHEGDYVLKIQYAVPKSDFMLLDKVEKPLTEKWYNAALIALVGNIEKGKIVRVSRDWPLVTLKTPNTFYYNLNRYSSHRMSAYEIKAETLDYFTKIAVIFQNLHCEELDKRVLHAIARVEKAKATFNLEDRIVELSLALEYLINTAPFEVSLQLRFKSAKLLGSNNEIHIVRTLNEFYKYRSKVVHGTGEIPNDSKTTRIVNETERIILDLLLRMIGLNQEFSFKQISDALDESLYLPQTLDEILGNK